MKELRDSCTNLGDCSVQDSASNGSVVALLQEIQERYNYLPEEILRKVAREKNIPLIDIYSVATFYKAFSLTPKGKHKIVTCSGTACHVRGSEKVTREISRLLGVEPGLPQKMGSTPWRALTAWAHALWLPWLSLTGNISPV
jgi:NADH:ubiquinone oxidoreductase subunit E